MPSGRMRTRRPAKRVKVSDVVGNQASTHQAGQRLHDLIEPALARGEPVELDFAGVRHFSALFFNASIGALIEGDGQDRLPPLLRYENLPPLARGALESVVEYAVRRRTDPRWAAAMDQAVAKWSQRE